MRDRLTFQDAVLKLHQYWADQGCLLWQPYYTQVGAGTMNPATVLRVLGPEPWRVGYVEPSIRPDDGRYGENPNRMQQHYQYQVILKPDPGNPQELYLQSLVALGIDPRAHDLRFVEDNWESPALGAWGLGWEVWLDGQEITQFTYFQQAGGLPLEPVSVELTYGLERILIALQGVDDFRSIDWDGRHTYGEINLDAEREHSTYYFEVADVERLRQMFQDFEAEAESALAAGLVLPAHDYVLKCSHSFNVLDTRGAIGVAERATLFGRMRELSRRVAQAYLAQREQKGFPWLEGEAQVRQATSPDGVAGPAPPAPSLLVFEIGVEELPPADLQSALDQLQKLAPASLKENRLAHAEVQVLGTPRRLAVLVENLAPRQQAFSELVKGPPAQRAFDEQGEPTKAAIGFARGKGVGVEDLQVREIDGGQYVVVEVTDPGEAADVVLARLLPEWIAGLRFEKSMRWNASRVAFSRPIRWLLALHGEQRVAMEYAGLQAGRRSRFLRFGQPESGELERAGEYLPSLASQGILVDPAARRALIQEQIETLANELGGKVLQDEVLLDEVTHLVEAPRALWGAFDEDYLALPRQVLISVMKKHQRYFPLVDENGALMPYFITVRNGGDEDMAAVRQGNEHVIRARFADAAYFVRADQSRPLESYLADLEALSFQAELGSMADKVRRIERLVAILSSDFGLDAEQSRIAARAAQLSKADLATQMVVEMTSLQGEMGREYALHAGEAEEVAQAIFEHYLPRSAGDQSPESKPGLVVGVADRLDTLMGLFAVGLQPSGTRDPYGLRRTAIGLIQMLLAHRVRFDLRRGLDLAQKGLPLDAAPGALDAALEFLVARQQSFLLAESQAHDVVEAVLVEQGHDPTGASQAVAALKSAIDAQGWEALLNGYARCARLTRGQKERYTVDEQRLVEPAARALWQAIQGAETRPRKAGSVEDFLDAVRPLVPAITRFFEEVMVMAEDEALRHNRLGLLQRIVALADGVADLSRLEGF